MFEDQNLIQTGDVWSGIKPRHQSPCACCSPVIAALNTSMQVTDEMLADLRHWQQRKPPLLPVSANTQLLVNARVYTVDNEFSIADCLAIKAGKILATGREADLRLDYEDAEIIDAGGKTILPGFIEPHMHFLPIATIGNFEDIGPFKYPTVAAALARLSELAAETPTDEWIMARQFDPSLQEGADTLTRQMLDQVSTDHAIFVYNTSLHFAYCNSRALALAGIDKDSADVAGSAFGRDVDGSPNGVLQGSHAMSSVARHNPAQRNYDLAEACFDVCNRANQVGVTTMCDQATGMARGVKEPELYAALAASGRMTARLRYSLSYALQEKWDETDIAPGDGDDLVRATAWKIVSDGSNQGFSGLQRMPYLNSDDCGVAYVEKQALEEMVVDRARRGWPLAIHANGDQAIDNVLDAYEAAAAAGVLNNPPYRIEHCSILHDEQISRIKQLGLSPSFLIGHVFYWGRAMRDQVFGQAKANLLDRTAACEAAGITWTLHSDEPVTEMNPLRCIENAVTRKLWREEQSKLAAEECIDVQTAIRAMTRDAAWQCGSDHEVGSLEAGKYADFIVLEEDPTEVDVDHIGSIRVLQTWMGGRKVYDASH